MVKTETSNGQFYNIENNRDYNIPKSVILWEELEKVLIEKEEAESYIPEWIEEWKKFIWPELRWQWQEEVEYFAKWIHNWGEIMQTLYIIKKLEKWWNSKTLYKELDDLYKDEGSSMAYADTCRLILLFAKRWVEFSREWHYTDEKSINFIKEIEERNKKMNNVNKDLWEALINEKNTEII